MLVIDHAAFAEECIRQGVYFGVEPHYLLCVAQLRSGISDDDDGDRMGPFRLTQVEWDAHRTDEEFDLHFAPDDVTSVLGQCAVFGLMAHRSFDAFVSDNARNPSALELYLRQWPEANSPILAANFQKALDDTAALLRPAADAVLGDKQSAPPALISPDQTIRAMVRPPRELSYEMHFEDIEDIEDIVVGLPSQPQPLTLESLEQRRASAAAEPVGDQQQAQSGQIPVATGKEAGGNEFDTVVVEDVPPESLDEVRQNLAKDLQMEFTHELQPDGRRRVTLRFRREPTTKIAKRAPDFSRIENFRALPGEPTTLPPEPLEPQEEPVKSVEQAEPITAPTLESDIVDVSVFGPETLLVGGQCIVQVFLHTLVQEAIAKERAQEIDPQTKRRGIRTLAAEIKRGTPVQIIFDGRGLAADESKQDLIWRGNPTACQFTVSAPDSSANNIFYPRILVLVNSAPIGSISFTLRIVTERQAGVSSDIRGERARRYHYAFLSYASPDRAEVLKRAQGLKAASIDFFQDLLKLEPGEHWKERLYQEIDRCDLFLLFWSTRAKESPWVTKEVDYALKRQKASSDGLPDITPVIIEGPPPPKPPDTMRDIHFNDALIYVLAAMQTQPPPSPEPG